jgi:hypothetical protein
MDMTSCWAARRWHWQSDVWSCCTSVLVYDPVQALLCRPIEDFRLDVLHYRCGLLLENPGDDVLLKLGTREPFGVVLDFIVDDRLCQIPCRTNYLV